MARLWCGISHMRRALSASLLLPLLALGCSGAASGALPGEGSSVRLARATWDTGWFQAEVFRQLLEELGYSVQAPDAFENVEFYVFASQGDIDLWPNGWFPLHDRYLDLDGVGTLVSPVGYQVEAGALQGYLVDTESADRLGVTNLGDLRDPDAAAEYDADGDGKADLIGCEPAWECGRVIDHHLETFGLNDTVTQVQGDYTALMKDAVERQAEGQAVLFYTWTPNWTIHDLPIGDAVAWLAVPFSSLPDDPSAQTQVDSLHGCRETPCDPGFPVNDIRVVANTRFLQANPAAAELIERVEIPLDDIASQNVLLASGEDTEDDLRRQAASWIESHRSEVDSWLADARAAAAED